MKKKSMNNNFEIKIFLGNTLDYAIDSRFIDVSTFNIQDVDLYKEMSNFVRGMSNSMTLYINTKKKVFTEYKDYKLKVYDTLKETDGFDRNFLMIRVFLAGKEIESLSKKFNTGRQRDKTVLNFLSSEIFSLYFDGFIENLRDTIKHANQYNDYLSNEVTKYMTEPTFQARFSRLEKLPWKEKSILFKKVERGEVLSQKDLDRIYFYSKDKVEEEEL